MGSGSSRNYLNLFLLAVIIIVTLELLSFVAATILLPTGILVTEPNLSGYTEYLEQRDPMLGWPSPSSFGTGEYDFSGSRLVPEFPDASTDACVALFGDSFTWGDEVAPEHSYGNVLSRLLGCRVANYGVNAYGTDQAAIRYMYVVDDDAPIVVLGIFSDNIVRNVNQLRDFIAPKRFGFKPRFILQSDGLKLVPLPTLSSADYGSVVARASQLLPHEYFAPGRLGSPAPMRFPYTKAIFTALFHYRVAAALQGIRPTYSPFYSSDHPSGALAVTTSLILHVNGVATNRNQRLLVLLIPDLHDLKSVRSGVEPSYGPLKQLLAEADITIIDAADYFVANHHQGDFCALFVTCGSSHFNPAGYQMLAEAVNEEIITLRFSPVR